uniref:Retrovirus-related Pol polyprotein from transposon TNT 1-94 n=1 Tax=Tanacetum cinerariifolium TaxID=118510 RepID=A0A6L2MUR3_TANCI|nr:retrovirus-related Pol polyprotein from transposon TNT 1-94 [Tanacetum cinerariifolium]
MKKASAGMKFLLAFRGGRLLRLRVCRRVGYRMIRDCRGMVVELAGNEERIRVYNVSKFVTGLAWSMFVTIVKKQQKLNEVSYHKLFDILKQYQKEVNELCAERLAKNANPLALVTTAQATQDPYYQTSKYKGKEIAKPITPPSETASKEDSDPDQAQRDKDMQKNLALITKTVNVVGAKENVGSPVVQQFKIQCFNYKEFGHFSKECRKPKRVKDSTHHKENMLMCKQDEQCVPLQAEQYDWLEDTDNEIDEEELEAHYSYMVKIQEVLIADTCTDSEPLEQVQNDTGYNVFANDLQYSEQSKSISNTCLVETDDSNVILDSPDMCDDDIQNDQNDIESDDERVTLANLIANLKLDVDENKKIQKELKKANTTLAQELKECKTILAKTSKTLGESNKIVDNACIKHSKDQFRSPTAQDMEILIQTCWMPLAIKTHNDSFIYVHEFKQEMHADLKYVETLEKEIDKLESKKAKFLNMYDMIWQECVSNDVMCSYLISLSDLDALAELRCLYLHKVKECDCLAQKLSKQTESYLKAQQQDKNITISELKKLIEKGKGKFVETKFDKPSVVRQPNAQQIPKPSVLGKPTPLSNFIERRYFSKTKSVPKTNVSEGLSKPVTAQTLPQTARQAVSNTTVLRPRMYRIENRTTQTRAPQSPQTVRNTNPRVSTSIGVNHKTNVSRPHHRSNQLKDKIVQLILFIIDSGCTKHMTGNLKLLCNFVEKFLGTVRIGNYQFALILGYGDLVQGNITINRVYYVEGLNHNLFSVGQFCDADLKVAFWKSTCFVRDLQGNDLLTGNRGSDLYPISLQESTSSTLLCLMGKASPTQAWLWHQRLSHLNFDYINLLSKKDVVIGLLKLKFIKD